MDTLTSRRLNDFLLAGGLAGLVILALLLDAVRNALVSGADSVTDQQRLLFLLPLMQLLLMLAALGLIWLCVSRAGYSRWVSALYLIVGLALLYALAFLAVLPFPDWMYNLLLYLSPESYLFQVGAAAAALGLISLFFWKEEQVDLPGEVTPDKAEIET
jgi:hypothetical protein